VCQINATLEMRFPTEFRMERETAKAPVLMGWTAPRSPASMCHNVVVTERHYEEEPSAMHPITISLDIAKLPLARDIDDFAFKDSPVNEALVQDLAGGGFIAQLSSA